MATKIGNSKTGNCHLMYDVPTQKHVFVSKPKEEQKWIDHWPYCPTCKQPFEFAKDEPFAYCECGTTEWGYPRPNEWIPYPDEWKVRVRKIADQLMLLPVFKGVIEEKSNDGQGLPHLKYMLREMSYGQMSSTKACRWLGYVQAALVLYGITTLDDEKHRNMDTK